MKPVKLFIPGPIHVSDKTFEAFRKPMIGHRSNDFKNLYAAVQPGLQTLFGTKGQVFLSTSSAWGVMEGALRNLVQRKVLCCMKGAFSDKWLDVAKRCGLEAEGLQVEWGQPILPEQVRAKLKEGGFDAVTLIHNETSTGTMSPLAEIAKVVREFEDVLLIVDTVSSFSAVPTPFDELGLDVLLTGSQKALAMPPGLALFTVSPRAMQRATQIKGRGYYFDFVEFEKNGAQSMTPSTPSIAHIYALQSKVEEILTETPEKRYARHATNNRLVREWGTAHGLQLLPDPAFGALSLNCFRNNVGWDLPTILKTLREKHGFAIDGGYGKLKGQTFRISNMGDETPETMQELLTALDDVLPR